MTRDTRLIVSSPRVSISSLLILLSQYQVDVVPEIETKVERQGANAVSSLLSWCTYSFLSVIRIFGIKTHTQMDSRLWDSVGHQLSRRGKEYMKRCTYRRPHTSMPGETSYLPKEWPLEGEPARERESTNPERNLPEFEPSKEDLEEMHSLLVYAKTIPYSCNCVLTTFRLDKYVSLSQAFLNSTLSPT